MGQRTARSPNMSSVALDYFPGEAGTGLAEAAMSTFRTTQQEPVLIRLKASWMYSGSRRSQCLNG